MIISESKILERGDLGFGILIERDAGYVSKELNSKMITEGVFTINPNEPVFINCILQKWGTENKNGRIYPEDVLVPQVEEYEELVNNNSAVSEADHPDCQNVDSQILTKNGWKDWEDISDNEEIQTLNTKTNKIEIQKIEKKIYEDYSGEMFEFKSRNFENTVTPNHRFLLEDNKGVRFYMTAQEIFDDVGGILSSGHNKILNKGEWIGEHFEHFKLNGVSNDLLGLRIRKDLRKKYTENILIKSEDWFAFLGIYLSDGHSSGVKSKKYNRGYEITITQKKEESKLKIKNLLNKLPFKYTIRKYKGGKEQYQMHDARLYEYLYSLGDSHNKYIPFEIKQASSNLLEIFFEWFMLGDGKQIKTKNNTIKKSVFSTSKKLIDDLQDVLIKIGGSGSITIQNNHKTNSFIKDKKTLILSDGTPEIIYENRVIKKENRKPLYNLNISNTKYIWLDKRSIKINKIDYDGKIACVKVPNSNFMTRVNGKSHWTGNSSVVSLHNISHLIKKMWWGKGEDANVLYGQLEIITSPAYMRDGVVSMVGDKVVEYLKRGIRLGISSRGVGTLKEVNGKNIVQNDFELICFDLVASPSTPGAYLFPEKTEMDFGVGMGENMKLKGLSLTEQQQKVVNAMNQFIL